MALVDTEYEHVSVDEQGVPFISGTTMKVVELVAEKMAYGWSPEEIHFQHQYLTLGQIYSALAYYSDHAEELNADVERRLKHAEDVRHSSGASPLVARLKSKGLL
jgi:uncharacterized protein (DUF433 family)